VATFGELLVKSGELAKTQERLLRSLFDGRSGADCDRAAR
jgi:hypothetical protein